MAIMQRTEETGHGWRFVLFCGLAAAALLLLGAVRHSGGSPSAEHARTAAWSAAQDANRDLTPEWQAQTKRDPLMFLELACR